MEPVAPRIARRVTTFPSSQTRCAARDEKRQQHEWGCGDKRIDAVEHAAVARQERPRVLHSGATLHPALEHITSECHRTDADRYKNVDGQQVAEGSAVPSAECALHQQEDDRSRDAPNDGPLPRLAGADARSDLAATEKGAAEV